MYHIYRETPAPHLVRPNMLMSDMPGVSVCYLKFAKGCAEGSVCHHC